jgi:uncharacterized membrane protein YdjX (TVP38/TMEM64 family)
MRIKNLVLPIIILYLLIFTWFLSGKNFAIWEYLKSNKKLILNFTQNNFFLSIFIYFGIYLLIVSLSIPVAIFLNIIGGLLFGKLIGTITVIVSSTIGASILFLGVKIASKQLISNKIENNILRIKKGFQKNAFWYLLTLRLFPFIPSMLVTLTSAIIKIPFKTFALGTLLGIIPSSYVYVSIGSALGEIIEKSDFSFDNIIDNKTITTFSGLALLFILHIIYKLFKKL